MDYLEIIKTLESNNLVVFKTDHLTLSEDDDMLLNDNSLDNFIRFCKTSGSNIVFLNPISVNQDDFSIFVEDVKSQLNELINEKVKDRNCKYHEIPAFDDGVLDVNFDSEVNIKAEEIVNKNVKLMHNLLRGGEEKTILISICTIYYSQKVGLLMCDNSDYYDLILEFRAIKEEMEDFAYDLVNNYFDQHANILINEMKKEENAKMQSALSEVKEIVVGNDDIKSYTNATLRKSYARKLIEDCEKKNGFRVPMWEVELMVTDAYNKTKKKK